MCEGFCILVVVVLFWGWRLVGVGGCNDLGGEGGCGEWEGEGWGEGEGVVWCEVVYCVCVGVGVVVGGEVLGVGFG